jgi:hypothetical protein
VDNQHFQNLEAKIKHLQHIARADWLKAFAAAMLDDLYRGIDLSEREIYDTLNGALRGSEFPGDLVGRLRDED